MQAPYAQSGMGTPPLQVKTTNGTLEGIDESGIRAFKGVPFAAPPLSLIHI